jgi:hypothetical protein
MVLIEMASTQERVDRLEEVWAAFLERFDRTHQELVELQRQADEDRRRADEDRRRADLDRRDLNKRMAELSDSMGTLIEDMVAPNAARLAAEIAPDDPVQTVAQRLKRHHPAKRGLLIEIDLLAAGRQHLIIFEAKRRVDAEKVREFLQKLQTIPEYFPEYASHRIIPVVASVNLDPSVVSFLSRQKVYGVAMGEHTMELVNRGAF